MDGIGRELARAVIVALLGIVLISVLSTLLLERACHYARRHIEVRTK